MKQIFSLLATSALLAAALPGQAKIWRLNNSNGGSLTPAINASFPAATTLQQAHDNASVASGDTIHVEQSSTTYGPLTMTKKLTIIGSGYFLAMNPKTQVNKSYSSPVGTITMTASTCAGSTITGLNISGAVYMGTDRLSVLRNYISNGSSYASCMYVGATGSTATDSNVIAGNYIDPGYYTYGIVSQPGSGALTNCIVSNNYIGSSSVAAISLDGRTSGLIKNNVIAQAANAYNMYVVNNITTVGVTNTFNNSLIEYNLGYSANAYQTPSGANNTITSGTNLVNTSQGFVGGTSSTDGAWQLASGSPAKASGKSGEDMGMFGGTLPYVLSGIPTVPNVYSLSIAPVAAGASSISVTVSTKSN